MSEGADRTSRETTDAGRGSGASVEEARERQSHVRHELRAPLAVMYPLLSLLLDGGAGELSAQQREYLEVLERNAVRLEALICGVADSGWADCSAAAPAATEVSLSDVVDEVLAMRRIDARKSPRVDVRTGPRPIPRAWADRDDVRQIVSNLVANAVAYTPPDGTVTVRIGACGGADVGSELGMVEVSVSDTGPGVPAEELPHVFDFGFRGELARGLRVPGLGAGLWVSRELSVRNGGSTRLESTPPAGTIATIVLPAVSRGTA